MKAFLRRNFTTLIAWIVHNLQRTRLGRFIQNELQDQIINHSMQMTEEVNHKNCLLRFTVPNMINRFRAGSFSTKEPETLEWIDSIPKGSVVWDIGANVGLYSCYAAKKRNCTVFAFEPSVFNLELLARNIFINELVEKITIIPLPLTDSLRASHLNMSTTDWGGALSTFGEEYGHDGKALEKVFEFSTIGLSIEDAVRLLRLPTPDYVKMDVDGIEHLILKGGGQVLHSVQGLLVEVNEDYEEQNKNVIRYLTDAGFSLKEKRHADMWEGNEVYGNTYNQIWHRQQSEINI
jgi:FkbM family methyltransferase